MPDPELSAEGNIEKYQDLLEREDFFPDYKENGTDLLEAGDPYLGDSDDEMHPDIGEAYKILVWNQSRSNPKKIKPNFSL
ncbi:unnamed protein product [Nyctereutes procyonoides]|uniref:(raccoon dog) hypothetical protein n=1 Tax=Nyctereutes procyonoides TaxID=34880 RepID=A0A811ZE01_NYCPR|nr:unnamed protein product [Nyctereutes procyonoides]